MARRWEPAVLAEEIGTDRVVTTDRRDLGVDRIHGRGRFRVVPG